MCIRDRPDSARSQSSGNEDLSAIREALHGRAEYIDHKFDAQRAHDIKPHYLQETLHDLGQLSKLYSETQRPALRKIRDLEDHIYAAKTLYDEPKHRSKYFAELRFIAAQLKKI